MATERTRPLGCEHLRVSRGVGTRAAEPRAVILIAPLTSAIYQCQPPPPTLSGLGWGEPLDAAGIAQVVGRRRRFHPPMKQGGGWGGAAGAEQHHPGLIQNDFLYLKFDTKLVVPSSTVRPFDVG